MTSAPTRNGTVPSTPREAAEFYALHGYTPIPIQPRDKKPWDRHANKKLLGWNELRAEGYDFDRLFGDDGTLNVGIAAGEPSAGEVIADLDCPEALLAAPFLLPPTGRRGGRQSAPESHRHYRTDNPPAKAHDQYKDPRVVKTDDRRAVLVELLSTGSQVVVAPSVHPEGERYVWWSYDEPAFVPIAALVPTVRKLAAASLLARYSPKGNRHDTGLALSGLLLRNGWSVGDAERFVEAWAVAARHEDVRDRVQAVADTAEKLKAGQNVTGFPTLVALVGDDLVKKLCEWLGLKSAQAAAAPTAKVRELPPYRPFPVEALPAPLAEYVRQGAVALGCDPAYLALPVLAAVASVVGNKRTVRLKRGWDEPSVVWSAIVGDSGTLKSPAYLKAVAYLFRLQRQFLKEFKEKLAKFQDDQQAYKEAKKRAKEGGTDPGDPPEPPVLRRVVCSDTTIEKLAEILDDNPPGTLLARDELSGWLGSFARYKKAGAGSDLPNWLEFFRAGNVVIDRKTTDRKNIFIERAAVSVTGGIQPGTLARALTPEFLDAGLAARLLMAMPPKLPKRWSEAEVEPGVELAYHGILDKLTALEFDVKEEEKVPYVLHLSREGKVAWVAFYDEWAREQATAEGELAAALSKLEAYAARFGLIHHVVTTKGLDCDDREHPIGVKSVEAGVTLCRWFAAEARRIYFTLSETEEDRDNRRLVEFVRARGGRITARGLQHANSRKYRDADEAREVLDRLVQAGAGDWVEGEAPRRGGHRPRYFILRPTHDTSYTRHDEPPVDDDPNTPRDASDTSYTRPDAGGIANDGRSDTRADTRPRPPKNQVENERVSEVSCVGASTSARNGTDADDPRDGAGWATSVAAGAAVGYTPSPQASGASVGQAARVSDAEGGAAVVPVTRPDDLPMVRTAVGETSLVGLDTETTGLDPRADRVRLLSLACDNVDGGTTVYLVDCFAVDVAPLWEALQAATLVGHNLRFDLEFLAGLGFEPGEVRDTMLMSQVLHCGRRVKHNLADCCERELGQALDKAEQAGDWSGNLTAEQLRYAALDAEVLRPLHDALAGKLKAADLTRAAGIENAALPAVAWLASSGVAFDRGCWESLAAEAAKEAERLAGELDKAAPPRSQREIFGSGWKWESPQHVAEALAAVGCPVGDTHDNTLAALDHPLAALLRDYRAASKLAGTYGPGWLKGSYADGRIRAGWHQLGADSGRMACAKPNLQNLPRDARYRRCFVAPPGRVLVKADYSQIELRIAAKVADERRMIDAYRKGEDLHTLTARRLLGKEDVTKADRQLAKAINFGLLYGMGARGFRVYARSKYGVELTDAEAERYRAAFFDAYPGLRRWHRSVGASGDKPTDTRTLTGRRRLGVVRFNDKLNLPVQGTGADGLKQALALLWQRRGECPGAALVLAVHDEIVVECGADQSAAAAAWLKRAMLDGIAPLAEPVPVEVEVTAASTWGG